MSVQIKESAFWAQVKASLSDESTHLTRVENDAGVGVFDITGCSGAVEVWIELKVVHGTRLYFRNSQRIWGTRRAQVGGRTFILARHDAETTHVMLYDAVQVFAAPIKPDKLGKSFSVSLIDMPTPKYRGVRPIDWSELRSKIFATGL